MSQLRQTMINRIESLEADTRRLQTQYGTGVRPAWVSAEISLNEINIAHIRHQLEKMEQQK